MADQPLNPRETLGTLTSVYTIFAAAMVVSIRNPTWHEPVGLSCARPSTGRGVNIEGHGAEAVWLSHNAPKTMVVPSRDTIRHVADSMGAWKLVISAAGALSFPLRTQRSFRGKSP